MKNSSLKRIVIAGGNGSLGRAIIKYLPQKADYVILSRKRGERVEGARVIWWDGENAGDWFSEIDGADVLINLCGRSVDCRYNEENKKAIIDSRVKPTMILGDAVAKSKSPPELWINAASATIYRYSEDKDMDETTGEYGSGFSVDVCHKWEGAFEQCQVSSTRKITLRISMVMGRQGGVLPVLLSLARKGLAGTMGTGKQYMSWIHEQDFVSIISSCIENNTWEGIFNTSAPEPLPNKKFMKLVRQAAGISFGLPAPAFLLEIGAFFMRTETELVLKSRKVVPGRLLKNGFIFKFRTAEGAIADLVKQ
jgi:uncharacterized protein (TIGR01777 family)